MTDLSERVVDAIHPYMLDAETGDIAYEIVADAARAALAAIHAAMQDIPPEAVRAMVEAFAEGREPMRDAARALADALFKEEGNG